MFTNEITAQGWTIVQETNGDTIFQVGRKFFAVCKWGDEFHIYQALKDGDYWQFLGNGKVGKAFRTVKAFVDARTK